MFRFALAAVIIACSAATSAEDADTFNPGQHYEAVTPAVATATADGRVEVVELFWYGCPHCFKFEPSIEKWLQTKVDYIDFVRIPAVFASNWEIHARAYYAAEQLGVLEATHAALFDALHNQQRKLFSEDELVGFYAEHGVAEDDFRAAYNSFDVDTKTRNAVALTRKYGISGVPSIIVNGKFRSGASKTGTFERLLKLVDTLAAKEVER